MVSYLIKTTSTNQAELVDELELHLGQRLSSVSSLNDPETSVSIEQIRDLMGTTHYASSVPHNWLLWNMHACSIPAQNALLKVLEEPPAATSFFLICSSLAPILDTIQSRCTILTTQKTFPHNTVLAADVYATICSGTIPQLIRCAESWKTADEAATILQELMLWLRHSPLFPSKTSTHQLILLSHAYDAIQANANVKLTLEHCFFEMKNSKPE